MKLITLLAIGVASFASIACQPDPVYVPVYVPTEQKVTKKVTPKPKPRPVESAETFRAVEKPTTYSY